MNWKRKMTGRGQDKMETQTGISSDRKLKDEDDVKGQDKMETQACIQ
jgi:hypothetical protein